MVHEVRRDRREKDDEDGDSIDWRSVLTCRELKESIDPEQLQRKSRGVKHTLTATGLNNVICNGRRLAVLSGDARHLVTFKAKTPGAAQKFRIKLDSKGYYVKAADPANTLHVAFVVPA